MKLVDYVLCTIAAVTIVSCSKKVDDDLINKKPTNFSLVEVLNEAADVDVLPNLQWNSSTDPNGDEVTYTLFLDTNEDPIKEMVVDLEANTFALIDPLAYETTYYWKVLAIDDTRLSTVSNQIFSFTTKEENVAPLAFKLISVTNNGEDINLRPILEWEEAKDPNEDELVYTIFLDKEEDPSTMIAENISETNFELTTSLEQGVTYYWKVKASDPDGLFVFSEKVFSFTTLKDNTAPNTFSLISLVNEATGVLLMPSFEWKGSEDPDGDDVLYTLVLDINQNPVTIIAEDIENTNFTLETVLEEDTTYYWKVIATDANGSERNSEEIFSFTTQNENTPPNPFTLIGVTDKAVAVDLFPKFSWNASTDDDEDTLTYTLYLDQTEDPQTIIKEGIEDLTYEFTEDQRLGLVNTYFWKVKASDGKGGETMSAVYSFVTRGLNAPVKVTENAVFGDRSGHTLTLFNDEIWLIGGSDSILNFYKDIWTSKDGVNWERKEANSIIGVRRNHITLVYDNKLWVIGGNLENDVWFTSDGQNWAKSTILPSGAINSHSKGIVYDGKIRIFDFNTSNTQKVLESTNGIDWTSFATIGADFLRFGFGLNHFKDQLWISGGNDTRFPTNNVYRSKDGRVWSLENNGSRFFSRINHVMTVLDSKMWVVGGVGRGVDYNDIWYTSDGINWIEDQENSTDTSFQGRDYESVVFKNKIWIIGVNLDNSSPSGEIWYIE